MASGYSNGAYRADLATGTTAGGVLALKNPFGKDVYLTFLALELTTASSGAGTVDAGIAANGTTSADNLIDGASVNATGVLTNAANAGTNGKTGQKWAKDQYLTISQASGAVAGLVGRAIIRAVPLGA
jgi:hypothetical protein